MAGRQPVDEGLNAAAATQGPHLSNTRKLEEAREVLWTATVVVLRTHIQKTLLEKQGNNFHLAADGGAEEGADEIQRGSSNC